jgi:hypothetical protein
MALLPFRAVLLQLIFWLSQVVVAAVLVLTDLTVAAVLVQVDFLALHLKH